MTAALVSIPPVYSVPTPGRKEVETKGGKQSIHCQSSQQERVPNVYVICTLR